MIQLDERLLLVLHLCEASMPPGVSLADDLDGEATACRAQPRLAHGTERPLAQHLSDLEVVDTLVGSHS